jgi:hypothetical protein
VCCFCASNSPNNAPPCRHSSRAPGTSQIYGPWRQDERLSPSQGIPIIPLISTAALVSAAHWPAAPFHVNKYATYLTGSPMMRTSSRLLGLPQLLILDSAGFMADGMLIATASKALTSDHSQEIVLLSPSRRRRPRHLSLQFLASHGPMPHLRQEPSLASDGLFRSELQL